MTSNITFEKGGITVDVEVKDVVDDISNKLFLITPPTGPSGADKGPADTKIIDLIRIVNTYQINGYITATSSYTAKQVKDRLKLIAKGANLKGGGVVTMTYDGDSIEGYIEKLRFTEVASDEPDTTGTDFVKYVVAITFDKGVSI